MNYGPPHFYDDHQRPAYPQARLLTHVKPLSPHLPPALNAEAISSLQDGHQLYDGPSLHSIMQAACVVTGVTMMECGAPYRERRIVRARHIYFYLARTLTPRSFPEIGRQCGRRDHTTVLHGYRKVKARLPEYADVIAAVVLVLGRQVDDAAKARWP